MHLDTHVVAWLYSGDTSRLSDKARELLETEPLVISPIVELELQYLYEIRRTTAPGRTVVADLSQRIDLTISDAAFSHVVANAGTLEWTRDPFDRLIVAQAFADAASLLTRDECIRRNFPQSVWD